MRVRITLAALVSLLAGAPAIGDAGTGPPSQPAGYAVDGDAFYVWDEDRDEAERWAAELARARPAERS